MRLLHATHLYMKVFHGSKIPPYVILSHRWEDADEEVELKDFELGNASNKQGYVKVQNLCRIAREYGVEWVWLDTCNIDKANSTELNEAINSMYKWYANSEFCVAYLFDYDSHKHKSIGVSTWFNRCWTLQELISPRTVRFYDGLWHFCGTKAKVCKKLAEITGIDTDTLRGADPRRCSIAQRMSWAAGRQATRIEDEAYSLLGLFDLSLPMLYGDGEKAFMTLQERIIQYSDDPTILAWDSEFSDDPEACHGLLAKSPSAFRGCRNTKLIDERKRVSKLTYNFTGVELETLTTPHGMNTYICVLDCTSSAEPGERDAILVERLEDEDQYARVRRGVTTIMTVSEEDLSHWSFEDRTLKVRQIPNGEREGMIHGFRLRFLSLPDVYESQIRYIRCLSRDGTILRPDTESGCVVVGLSQDLWGTVALISLPESQHKISGFLPRHMRLGFDKDFNPMVEVTSQRQGVQCDQDWTNSWLQEPRSSGSIPLKTGGTAFYRRFISKDPWDNFWLVSRMNLTITIKRKKIVSKRAAEGLAKCGNGPWDIWEVKIKANGSFVDDRRAAQERRRNENHYKIAWSAVAGTLLLGGTIEYLESRELKKREKEREEEREEERAFAIRCPLTYKEYGWRGQRPKAHLIYNQKSAEGRLLNLLL